MNIQEAVEWEAAMPSLSLPLIKRVFSKTLATELMTVQPLSMPNGLGLAAYMDVTYTKTPLQKALETFDY